jgi:tRNA nucleotidyltransferase/poly(A) polymerase
VEGQDIKVATFRKDGPYHDGRKPDSVEFSSEKEDALRRDFTINAMFYDLQNNEVIDFVGGQKDLMRKTLRTVGDPDQRFAEDKLRILRAVRFHAQLGFAIEPATAEAIRKHSVQIHQVSMERIRDEWQKLMLAEHAVSGIQRTNDLGLWSQLFGAWKLQTDEYKKLYSVSPRDADKAWILWFLLHCQESKEKLVETAMHWKLPKKLIQSMVYCLQSLSQLRNIQNVEAVDLAIFLAKPNGRLAVEIYQTLHQGRIKDNFFERLKTAEAFFRGGRLPDLLITGDDLIGFGVAPGPEIAKQLKRLYRVQIKNGIRHKEDLMKKVKL